MQLNSVSRAIVAILIRDIKHLLRHRSRLLSALMRPLIWFFVIGTGLRAVVFKVGVVDYQSYLVPGLLSMVLLFGGVVSALSMARDKDSGVMRMLLVAPIARGWIVIARTMSSAFVAMIHVFLLFVILLPFLSTSHSISVFLLLSGTLAIAFACAALGMIIAVYSNNFENYAVVMNFVIFPVFFLSGALYPISKLPLIMKSIVLVNPFSFCVDLLQHAMGLHEVTLFTIMQDFSIIIMFSLTITLVSVFRFSNGELLQK